MFSKKNRIPKYEIGEIISSGDFFYKGDLLNIKKLDKNYSKPQFAVIVSKKVSKKAVERHLIKRRIIAAIKEIQNIPNSSYVFFTKPEIKNKSFKEIKEIIQKAFK